MKAYEIFGILIIVFCSISMVIKLIRAIMAKDFSQVKMILFMMGMMAIVAVGIFCIPPV